MKFVLGMLTGIIISAVFFLFFLKKQTNNMGIGKKLVAFTLREEIKKIKEAKKQGYTAFGSE